MSKTAVITTRIESEKLEALEALAKRLDRSRAWVVSEAINAYIAEQTEFLDFVQQGTDDLDNGRWIDHEDLAREIKQRRSQRHAA
jgi:predicted transcriptional regulator